jgi:hypothetical protein
MGTGSVDNQKGRGRLAPFLEEGFKDISFLLEVNSADSLQAFPTLQLSAFSIFVAMRSQIS